MNPEPPLPPRGRRPFLRGCAVVALVFVAFFVLIVLLSHMDDWSLQTGEKVAVLPVTGLIADSEATIEQLKKFAKDDSIKAIVIRINSPGGGVGPSQEIYEEVKKLKGKKIVLASMGALAASGGYYIACGTQKIYANPGTITGSIGVIMNFVNVKELIEKIGLKGMVVKSGAFKDIGSPVREMKPEERELLQGVIDNVHSQFIAAVADGRKMDRESVAKIADGRIFSGEQAKALGLVDALGNLEDAVADAGKLAKISGEPRVVTPSKKKLSILELLKEEAKSIIGDKLSEQRLRIEYLAQ
ncbi:MAG: signal peptide peptidase SppA [Deltaproteobacteria bacterium]|nr:signal peptide peptidase SppA [Deltaproteobacteria bacterium]PWB63712.1 MAG: signal peptide peptidase SppA [Deltaproteobacteria bacterium]